MSTDGSVELTWAGDLRTFRLGIDQLLALQERLDSGPMQVAQRLRDNSWRVQDIMETIRLGLMGAGMDGKAARDLVANTVGPPMIAEHALIAYCVLISAIAGEVKSPPVGKPKVAGKRKMAASTPPPSSEAAR